MKSYLWLSLLLLTFCAPQHLFAQSEIPVHDPVMIEQEGSYYLFGTGKGIAVWSSPDMENWQRESAVFKEAPAWSFDLVPDFDNVEWAPDIVHHNDKYYLYYSVSQFGRNNSAIGVATNTTLDASDSAYQWVDHGPVVQSVPGRDMWNAIDPNLAFDDEGTPWLSFGSFWMGLKMVKMQDDLLSIAREPQTWHTIAARHRDWKVDERDAGDAANPELDYDTLYSDSLHQANQKTQNGAIEAPFIFKKNGYYYLFASWDRCCNGKESTYKVVVGRSKNIEGPYLDKKGNKLIHGGGTIIASGNSSDRWAATGHQAAYTFDRKDYLIMHGYDNTDEGHAKLIIRELSWNNDWPEISL